MSIKDGVFLYNNKNINLHNFFSRYLGININKNIFSYTNDYKILYKIYKQIKKNKMIVFHDEKFLQNKAEKQINEIMIFLDSFLINTKEENKILVDIGCGNGLLTHKFSKLYNFNHHTYCVETLNYLDKSVSNTIKFSITDGNKINLDNNFADLTICFLAIHHFSSIESMINEIIRISKPNSYLLIYEHDCISSKINFVLDLYHIINGLLLKPNLNKNYKKHYSNFISTYYSNYTSKEQLINKLSKDFILLKTKEIYKGFVNNYYALFQKK
jgi:ubiquinone/menaquinone biosynthesis C-methylase UbiE